MAKLRSIYFRGAAVDKVVISRRVFLALVLTCWCERLITFIWEKFFLRKWNHLNIRENATTWQSGFCIFFFYNLLRDDITQIRISKQWKFHRVLFFTEMKRSRKRKREIHKVFNLTRLALYDATITKMPITIITFTRGTHYLFRCKELYKKIFFLRRISTKKIFHLWMSF